jgi:hypothetical protein
MGVVYRGFDPDIRRLVALKTIRRQLGEGANAAETAARFRNEAQAAGRLLHPGIVGVYDFGDDGRIAYIAMEYVEGRTLAHYLANRQKFADADIACLIGQVLDALQHAHEHGVWHRDVKPSNVIITPQGRAKIADFGIARTENSGLTMANSVLGTPMYMAPEQFTGRGIDHRIDLYATGVLLYQLVAGRPPFVGSPEVLMYKVVNDVPPPPSSIEGEGRTARFDSITGRALAKDPAQRFAGAQAFRQALVHPLAGTLSPESILDAGQAFAPTERIPTGMSTSVPTGTGITGEPPAHFDAAELAQIEASLARHVGPMAKVMVRRTARQAHDITELYAALAEQITSSTAREAFLGQASKSGHATGGSHGSGSTRTHLGGATGPVGTTAFTAPIGLGSLPVSDAWLEQAAKLLLGHVGPIAKLMVKRASERSRIREALIQEFTAAVPEAQRAKLLAELQKLA